MKINILPLVAVLLLSVSAVRADYEGMKKEQADYSPPDFLSSAGNTATGEAPETAHTDDLMEVLSDLDRLKSRYRESVLDAAARLEALMLDQERVPGMSEISSDPKIIKETVGRRIVLDEIKILAALRNPGILAAQKSVTAEIRSFDQVMDLDDSLRRYTAFTRALDNKAGPRKTKDAVRMAYPGPGLTALKGRIIEDQVALLSEKLAIATKKVLTDVEKSYWDLVFVEASTRITRETIAAFARLRDVATTLYKSGRTSFQDVIKINISIEELNEELVTLAEQRKNVTIRILELLDLPAGTRTGPAAVSPLPQAAPRPEALYDAARESRQELKVIRFQIRKLEHMVEMAETMVEAPFSPGLSFSENEFVNTAGSDAPKAAFASKTMAAMKNGSPIKPWYGADEAWLGQTRQNLLSRRQTLVEQENAADRMVRNAWFKTDKNRREYFLYKNRILPLAKSALDVSTKEYEAGSIPFSQAIGSYTYWLKVKLTIAKKRSNLGSTFAELENIIGKKL